jgi:hypothetical protein
MARSYLMVDNRVDGGRLEEYDLIGCRHCQRQLKISRHQREGFYCMKCNGPVCDDAKCNARCEPFYRKVERSLARARFLEQVTGS